MTVCNACGSALPAYNLAFLCHACSDRVPQPVLMRYRRAALAVYAFRLRTRPARVPAPPAFVDELARAWSAAADIARASLPEKEEQ